MPYIPREKRAFLSCRTSRCPRVDGHCPGIVEDYAPDVAMCLGNFEPSESRNVPSVTRWKIFKRDGYRCLACGSPDNLTIDHIKHRHHGGTHEASNLRTLCRSCNSRRGTGYLPEVDQ